MEEKEINLDKEFLNNYAEIVKRRNSNIVVCTVCGDNNGTLYRVDKKDKNKGFVCKNCLIKIVSKR